MAVVRFGPIVQSASGALGSVVFARQGGIGIVRPRPMKVNQESGAQLSVRARYARIVGIWRSLPDGLRMEWFRGAQGYAHRFRDGRVGRLTAWQLFLLVTARQFSADGSYWPYLEFTPPNIERIGVRLDVWPGGPVNLVTSVPNLASAICYSVYVQRTYRVRSTLPGRLFREAYAGLRSEHSTNITDGFRTVAGDPGIGEYVRWRCISYRYQWPASVEFTGLLQVPNVSNELVANGDMEAGVGWGAPTGWVASAGTTLSRVGGGFWGDLYGARWEIAAGAASKWLYTQGIGNWATAGTYVLRFAARSTVGVAWNEILATWPGHVSIVITTSAPPADGLWYEYEYSFDLPGGWSSGELDFHRTGATAVDVYLDNVSIRRNL